MLGAPTVSRRFPWQLSDSEKKEMQNEKCWIPYMELHQRESRSGGNMMSRNGTGGTDQGRGGPALVAFLISPLLDPTLMIWGPTYPLSYSLSPSSSSWFIIFFLTSFLPSYIWRQSWKRLCTQVHTFFFLISPHLLIVFCYTNWENPYHSVNISLFKKKKEKELSDFLETTDS